MCTPCSPSPCCNQSNGTVCGDKDQAPTGLSAALPTGPDKVSLAPPMPVTNVSHTSPSNIRGGLPSSDSTIRGRIARSDSTNLRVLPSRSTESSLSSSDLPDVDSQASSSGDKDDARTISTVAYLTGPQPYSKTVHNHTVKFNFYFSFRSY